MFIHNDLDQQRVDDRVAQFRRQMTRFVEGRLGEDNFRPLRLQNGLYATPRRARHSAICLQERGDRSGFAPQPST